MGNLKYGTTFSYKNKKYVVIGDDIGLSEIECQTVPFNDEYYWFKVLDSGNKVQMI